jgi:hypothetical protein
VTLADLEEEFLRSDMLTLADAVKDEFVAGVLHAKPEPIHLTGRLSLLPESKTKANCTVFFTTDWMNTPPQIFCHDVWLRREQDWHTNAEGNLCYVLKAQWAKRLQEVSTRHDIVGVVDYARRYLARNTRWLLQRHFQGYRENIKVWQWVGWGHGTAGIDEFLDEEAKLNPSP